jgi:hypothetical protein
MAWVQLLLLVLVAIALPGCEVVGGIFKAGAWVGAVAVILIIAIVGILAAKIRGKPRIATRTRWGLFLGVVVPPGWPPHLAIQVG